MERNQIQQRGERKENRNRLELQDVNTTSLSFRAQLNTIQSYTQLCRRIARSADAGSRILKKDDLAPANPLQTVRGLTRRSPNGTAVANLRALGMQRKPLIRLTDATDELICYKVRIGACACQYMVLRVLVPCMGFGGLCSAPRQASYYARAINDPLCTLGTFDKMWFGLCQ